MDMDQYIVFRNNKKREENMTAEKLSRIFEVFHMRSYFENGNLLRIRSCSPKVLPSCMHCEVNLVNELSDPPL